MAKTAIVTGASSGLGREYVRQLSEEADIEEFWVIARRKERLQALAEEVPQRIKILPLDLTKTESIQTLKDELESCHPDVRVLVNAAGMGKTGPVKKQRAEEVNRMIDLNIRAMADVTAVVLPYLSRGSRIINIGSVAGFQPLPQFDVYSATKAFVESYTKGLHYELIGTGIHCTCVCPYWVKDTEFIPNAVSKDSRYQSQFLAQKSRHVVSASLKDSRLNLWVSTPGIVPVLDRFFSWTIPHCVYVPLMDLISRMK